MKYADVGVGSTCAVIGLGPIGQMCARIAKDLGAEQVLAVDSVPERLELARRHDIAVLDERTVDDVPAAIREMTGGRGVDGSWTPAGWRRTAPRSGRSRSPRPASSPARWPARPPRRMGVDRMGAMRTAFASVRRAGAISLIGVYGGQADPFPMRDLFDKGVTIRMGQAHAKRWVDEIMPALTGDDDPLGTQDLTTHALLLEQAAYGYGIFQKMQDGCIKTVLNPDAPPTQARQGNAPQLVRRQEHAIEQQADDHRRARPGGARRAGRGRGRDRIPEACRDAHHPFVYTGDVALNTALGLYQPSQ